MQLLNVVLDLFLRYRILPSSDRDRTVRKSRFLWHDRFAQKGELRNKLRSRRNSRDEFVLLHTVIRRVVLGPHIYPRAYANSHILQLVLAIMRAQVVVAFEDLATDEYGNVGYVRKRDREWKLAAREREIREKKKRNKAIFSFWENKSRRRLHMGLCVSGLLSSFLYEHIAYMFLLVWLSGSKMKMGEGGRESLLKPIIAHFAHKVG